MPEDRPNQALPPRPGPPTGRDLLLKKLQGLIAILEIALGRVREERRSARADREKLDRVEENLDRTLRVCRRAELGLRRGDTLLLPDPDPSVLGGGVAAAPRPMTYRDYVELSSLEEFQRFRTLPPLRADEVKKADIRGLLERFGAAS